MKRKFFFFAAVFGMMLLIACGGEQKPAAANHDPAEGPQMELSVNDTVTVRQLTNDFLELLKQGNVDDAISRLFVVEGDDIRPFPEDQREGCRFALSLFPVYDYHIVQLIFFRETDSEVKYELVVQDPTTTESPATMRGLIRPVRRGGMWYITLANSDANSLASQLDD